MTVAARQILFERHPVAFLHTETAARDVADFLDAADGLVTEDERSFGLRVAQIIGPVAAADARQLDMQQARVGRHIGTRKLAHFSTARRERYSSGDGSNEANLEDPVAAMLWAVRAVCDRLAPFMVHTTCE